jgi:hypothetical protein
MPGFVLHLGAQVQCLHGGQAQPTAPNPRILLSGMAVVTIAGPYVVAGCTLPPPILANGPCVTAQFVTSATRVLASGQPVLLLDSQAICAPTATPLVILQTQTRVLGM